MFMRKEHLTAKFVKSATSKGKEREIYWDARKPGFGLMVTAAGARSYVIQYRAGHRSRRMTIKAATLAQARNKATALLGDVTKGNDPLDEKRKAREGRADTLKSIVEKEYLGHPSIKRLRSSDEIEGTFRRYVFPKLGARPVKEIRRREIVQVLERVQEKHGIGAANSAYKVLRRFLNWYAARDDDFTTPIVKGIWEVRHGKGARALTDDEIRILWKVASEGRNAFDHYLRFTLLTATRRDETARMMRSELSDDGSEWIIPASRYKGEDGKSAHAHLIPLSPLARQVLDAVPAIMIRNKPSQWIFTSTGEAPISGFSAFKKAFDQRLQAALDREGDVLRERIVADLKSLYPDEDYEPFGKGWSPHSLRKTARTLLGRIKIDKDIAEKCLGHIEVKLIKAYDHHRYTAEKRTAFEALAREVERIAHGGSADVIPLVRT
jgi:hypothetical protein